MRNAIAGCLDYLNRKITIDQYVNGQDEKYAVKFYYNFGSDEQIMKDFFVQYDHGCLLHKNPEGNFDMRPVGVLKFNSFSIRTSDMTNKYVRGSYTQESTDDNLQKSIAAYSAYLFRLPMTIKMSADIEADNLGQSMRVMESILTNIYKSNTIYFQFNGVRVPAELLMSDSIDLDKKTDFTYDDNNKSHAKFDFDINTTFPIFDDSTIRSKAHTIRQFRMMLNGEEHDVDYSTKIESELRNSGIIGSGVYQPEG